MLVEGCYYIDLKRIIKRSKQDKISLYKALEWEKSFVEISAPFASVDIDIKYTGITYGRRPWLICPDCRRRCAQLFVFQKKISCRICHNLKYKACTYHRNSYYENFGKHLRRFKKLTNMLYKKMRRSRRAKLEEEHHELFVKLNDAMNAQIILNEQNITKFKIKCESVLKSKYPG